MWVSDSKISTWAVNGVIRLLICGLLLVAVGGCQSESLAEGVTENTTEEDARLALADGDYELAIELYTQVISGSPDDYQSYLRLGTAYAGRAGIRLVELVKDQLSSAENTAQTDTSANVIDTIGQFVPNDPSDQQMTDINTAISTIQLMPSDHRTKGGPYSYSNEASFTLNLYLSSSSAMLVNRYSETDVETGEVSRESLEQMSDEEVDTLLNNLESVASSGDEELGPEVQETLDAINNTEGSTQKEKLLNYLSTPEGQAAQEANDADSGS